jgi:hypothetical protein
MKRLLVCQEACGTLKTRMPRIASWWSFSTARRRALHPATLDGALIRLRLVYPLASFDVSGQWPVSHAAAWPNEVFSLHRQYTPVDEDPSSGGSAASHCAIQ